MRAPWRKLSYPPGPPSKGIISGNKSDVSVPMLWRVCADILYLRVSNKPMIVLNSLKDATELLDKRSRNFLRARIRPCIVCKMGFTFATALKTYGPEWRTHRRILQQTFKPESALAYRPTQTQKMHDALYELLTNPKDFDAHIRTYAGAIVLSVTYRYDVLPKDDRLVDLLESTRPAFSQGPSPRWLVNTFPLLRHVPSWFPGSGFKDYASSIEKVLMEQRETPFKYTADSLASGNTRVSVISGFLEKCHSEADTASSIMNIFIAMISFPDVQKKAQSEIDRVVGSDRLPNYSDQASLPYVTAVLREVIRWKPLVPLGLPHASKDDDIYQGFTSQKASLSQQEKYKDPEAFNPDRFFDEKGDLNDDDVGYAFGFGRRICPGRHLGSASVWLAIATILSTFKIGKNKDSSGNELPLEVKFIENGLLSYPLPFECSVTPRSDHARQLITEAREVEA
ncbi:cytochrome P450 [Pholiota molesta]|nr:cytochrome P450 [Pholiota molesta]